MFAPPVKAGPFRRARWALTDRVQRFGRAFDAGTIAHQVSMDIERVLSEEFLSIASIGGVRALARSGIGPLLADVEGACFKPPPAKRSPSRARGKSRFRRMRWIMPSKHAAVLPPQWRSSMARNLEDGRRLEVDALSGAVVRRGVKLGIPTPLHLTIAACCRCISPDEKGRPWDRGSSETSPARRRAARCRSLQSTASRAPAATWRPSQGCPAGYRDRDDSRLARLILSCFASRAIPAFLRLRGAPVSSAVRMEAACARHHVAETTPMRRPLSQHHWPAVQARCAIRRRRARCRDLWCAVPLITTHCEGVLT